VGVRVEFVSILVSDTKGGSEERKHTVTVCLRKERKVMGSSD
jgi:hypothetical protein